MTEDPRPKVLCVDDEPNVLEGLSRHLRRQFNVTVAVGTTAGVEALQQDDGFAVVISDLRMPGPGGVVFLTWVREIVPDAVRILLTGNVDLESALAAINEGRIFRILQKPCPPEVLIPIIAAAAEQYRLVTSERVLLERTLQGSIQLLTDLLALVHPAAFGRANRTRQRLSALGAALRSEDGWSLELAGLLSQIGLITLAPELVERIHAGRLLSEKERAQVAQLPSVAERLLAHIPRLEPVREILRHQDRPFVMLNGAAPLAPGERIPQGARMLRLVLDFDRLEAEGVPAAAAIETLQHRAGQYDPEVLAAFRTIVGGDDGSSELRELTLGEVRVGMRFAVDVITDGGVLLVARGQEVTPALMDRIENFWQGMTIAEPIRVLVPVKPAGHSTQA